MQTDIIVKMLQVEFIEGGTGVFIVNDIDGWYYFSARQSYRVSADLTVDEVLTNGVWYNTTLIGGVELTEIDLGQLIGLAERLDGIDAALKDLDDRVTALEQK